MGTDANHLGMNWEEFYEHNYFGLKRVEACVQAYKPEIQCFYKDF